MKLPREIVKKYGITKKAWSVYRSRSGGAKRRRSYSKSAPVRARSGSVAKKRKRSYSRASRGGGGSVLNIKDLLFHAGYGAVRQDVVGFVDPIASKIPLGAYSRNATMIGLAWVVPKFLGGGPMVKDAARAIARSEAFLAGGQFRAGGGFGALMTTTASSNGGAVLG